MKRLSLLLIPFVLLTLASCGNARYTTSGTKLSDIREFAFLKRLDGVDNRYGLFIYSLGYTTTVNAYNRERITKAASKVVDRVAEELTGITGLTNPSGIYTPNDPYGNEMICVVIDKQEQRIVYYNKQNPTFASFPTDDDDVNKLLHKLLKDFIR